MRLSAVAITTACITVMSAMMSMSFPRVSVLTRSEAIHTCVERPYVLQQQLQHSVRSCWHMCRKDFAEYCPAYICWTTTAAAGIFYRGPYQLGNFLQIWVHGSFVSKIL